MGGVFQGVIPIANGSSANPGLPYATMPTTGFFKSANSGLGLALAGFQYLDYNSAGASFGKFIPNATVLTELVSSPYALSGTDGPSLAIAFSPTNNYLAVGDWPSGTARLYLFSVNQVTGVLTPVAGSPFATTLANQNIRNLAWSPDGNFIYAMHEGNLNISVYDVNKTINTGLISEIAGSPYSTGTIISGFFGSGVSIPPALPYIYFATSEAKNQVYGFIRNTSTGALTAIGGSPWTMSTTANDTQSVITPDSAHLFITNSSNGAIEAFTINAGTGTLSAVAGSPFALPGGVTGSRGITVTPDGSALLVGGNNGTVYTYNINSTTGALSLNSQGAFALTANSIPGLNTNQSGTVIYATQSATNALYALSRDPVTGILTLASGSPYSAGTTPVGVAALGNSFVYANCKGSFNIHAWTTLNLTTVPLFNCTFDPTGGFNGTFNVNGFLTVNGQPIKSNILAGVTNGAPQVVGQVGEVQTARLLQANAIGLTTGTPADVTSLTLTPGVWEISGQVGFIPAATTVVTAASAGISTTSGTLPNNDGARTSLTWSPGSTIGNAGFVVTPLLPITPMYVNITVNTTYYLPAVSNFTTSTMSAFGQIMAKRIR